MLEVEIKNFTVNTSTISYLQNSQSNPIKRVITSLIPPNKNKFVFVQKFYRFCLDNNNDRQVYFYFQNEYEELKENNTNNTLVLIEIDTNDGVKKLLEFTITNSREFRLADRYVIKFTTDTKISYLQTCITLNNQSSSDGNNNTTVTNYVQDYIPINFSENTYEKENSIILPFYIYPYDYEKNDFVDDVKKLINKINSTQVPFYIIINPNSGLGDSEDSKYTEFIRMVISAGGYPIGYIPTGYGNRSISDIKSDIDKWKQLYPDVHGIFFDEVSTNVTKDYVKDICGYANDNKFKFTVLNFGTEPEYSLFKEIQELISCACTYENNTYNNFNPSNDIYKYTTRYKKCAIINSQQQLDYSKLQLLLRYFKYVYITDNYESLPSYFNEEVDFIENSSLVVISNRVNTLDSNVNSLTTNASLLNEYQDDITKSFISYLSVKHSLTEFFIINEMTTDSNNVQIQQDQTTKMMILPPGKSYSFTVDITKSDNTIPTYIAFNILPINRNLSDIVIEYDVGNGFTQYTVEDKIQNKQGNKNLTIRITNNGNVDYYFYSICGVFE